MSCSVVSIIKHFATRRQSSAAWSFDNTMRLVVASVLILAAVGCSTTRPTDPRLIGTWQSNRDQTVAEIFRRDPKWTNASPEKVQKLRDIFGHMRITYSANSITTEFRGEKERLGYRVVDRGDDFVVIRIKGGLEDGHNQRIRFVDDGRAYWLHSFLAPNIEERFDRVAEPSGSANRSEPIGSETNRTSPAAGPSG